MTLTSRVKETWAFLHMFLVIWNFPVRSSCYLLIHLYINMHEVVWLHMNYSIGEEGTFGANGLDILILNITSISLSFCFLCKVQRAIDPCAFILSVGPARMCTDTWDCVWMYLCTYTWRKWRWTGDTVGKKEEKSISTNLQWAVWGWHLWYRKKDANVQGLGFPPHAFLKLRLMNARPRPNSPCSS